MNFKPRTFYFIMILVLFLSVTGSVLGFLWTDKQLKTKSQTVSNLLADRDAQNDDISKLRAAGKTAQQTKEITSLISSALPNQKKQELLVADIVQIASTTPGLSSDHITNIGFSGSGVPNALSGATVSKDVQGVYIYPFNLVLKDIKYTTLINMLQRLELNKRITQIDQIQLTPDGAKPGFLSSVSLSVKAFLQP